MATATKKKEEVSSARRVEQSEMEMINRLCDLAINLALGKGKGGFASKEYISRGEYYGPGHSWCGFRHGTRVVYIPKLEVDARTSYLLVEKGCTTVRGTTTVLEAKLRNGTINILRIDFTSSGPGTWEGDLTRDFDTLSEVERDYKAMLRRTGAVFQGPPLVV